MHFEFCRAGVGTRHFLGLAAMLGAALGSGLAEASPEYSNDKPVWEQVDVLICQGNKVQLCNGNKCSTDIATAMWRVDFRQSKVVYMNGREFVERILAKNFKFYSFGSVSAVFMEGRALRFFVVKDNKFPAHSNRIAAAVSSADYISKGWVFDTMDFDCFETR